MNTDIQKLATEAAQGYVDAQFELACFHDSTRNHIEIAKPPSRSMPMLNLSLPDATIPGKVSGRMTLKRQNGIARPQNKGMEMLRLRLHPVAKWGKASKLIQKKH